MVQRGGWIAVHGKGACVGLYVYGDAFERARVGWMHARGCMREDACGMVRVTACVKEEDTLTANHGS